MDEKQKAKLNTNFLNGIKDAVPKHCSNCGNKYEENDLILVQKEDFQAIFHLVCKKCHESYLINVMSPMGVMQSASRIPLRIDIASGDEAKRFVFKEKISSNEVLAIHKKLKTIKSFYQIIKELL